MNKIIWILLIYSIIIFQNYTYSSFYHIKNIRNYLKLKTSFIPSSIDWLDVIGKMTNMIEYIASIKLNNIDLTSGRVYISNPELYDSTTFLINGLSLTSIYNDSILDNRSKSLLISSLQSQSSHISSLYSTDTDQKSTLLKIHQFSTKVIKKVPDYALIGALTLIGTELVKREVSKQSSMLPPIMQELANKTLYELDMKLETITTMQYDIDPFLKLEYQRLQSQPSELMDKFIATEIVAKVELELPTLLSKVISEKKTIKLITEKIIELIKLIAIVLLKPGSFNQINNINRNQYDNHLENEGINKEVNIELNRMSLLNDLYKINQSTSSSQNNNILNKNKLKTISASSEWNRIIEELLYIAKSEGLYQQIFLSLTKSVYPYNTLLSNINNNIYDNNNSFYNTTTLSSSNNYYHNILMKLNLTSTSTTDGLINIMKAINLF